MALGLFQSAALSLPDSEAAMQAKVDAVNASGGIDGHQIDLTTCNDQLDPDQSAACARQAVSNGDVAVVASYEPYTAQVLPILESANIPFFNGEAIDNGDANSAIEFPLTGGVITQYAAVGEALATNGCKNMGVIAVNAEVVQVGAQWAEKGMAAKGGKSTQVNVSLEQPTFDSELAQLSTDGAQCIVPATNPPQGASIEQSLKQRVPVGAIASEFPQQALTTLGPLANKTLIADQEYQPWDTTQKGIEDITAAMSSYTPSVKLTESFGVLGWASMTAALDVIGNASDKTAAGILTAARTTASVNTDGLLGTFGWNQPGPVKSLPKFTNWNYLTWTVTGGVVKLSSQGFVKLTGVG
jgi:ABC-type branched-subunit amino acid transport system substrate-binding protein